MFPDLDEVLLQQKLQKNVHIVHTRFDWFDWFDRLSTVWSPWRSPSSVVIPCLVEELAPRLPGKKHLKLPREAAANATQMVSWVHPALPTTWP